MTDFELLVIGAVIGAFICLIFMMIGVVIEKGAKGEKVHSRELREPSYNNFFGNMFNDKRNTDNRNIHRKDDNRQDLGYNPWQE